MEVRSFCVVLNMLVLSYNVLPSAWGPSSLMSALSISRRGLRLLPLFQRWRKTPTEHVPCHLQFSQLKITSPAFFDCRYVLQNLCVWTVYMRQRMDFFFSPVRLISLQIHDLNHYGMWEGETQFLFKGFIFSYYIFNLFFNVCLCYMCYNVCLWIIWHHILVSFRLGLY